MKQIYKQNIKEYKNVYKTDSSANSYEVKNKVYVLKKIIPKLKNNSRILEIGYGTGDLLHFLSKHHPKVEFFGVEVVKEALDLYRKRFPKDKNVKLFLADANKKFSFSKKEYDIIILSHVLEHLEDEDNFFKNVLFVLKKRGYIVIAVPQWGDSDLHYRQYDKKQLIDFQKKYKLKLTLIKGDGFYLNKFFYKLLRFIGITGKENVNCYISMKKREKHLRKSIKKFLYYKLIVNSMLVLNNLDTLLFSRLDSCPIQWIAVYKK